MSNIKQLQGLELTPALDDYNIEWQQQAIVFGYDRVSKEIDYFADQDTVKKVAGRAEIVHSLAPKLQRVDHDGRLVDYAEVKRLHQLPFQLTVRAGSIVIAGYINEQAFMRPKGERFGRWHILESLIIDRDKLSPTARTYRQITHGLSGRRGFRSLSATKPASLADTGVVNSALYAGTAVDLSQY